ncbi:MAG: sporulation protein YqfD, partial [Clostridia bacterium]|nr:sporulation protein YqfD [Clostridia bacterium]
TDGEKLPVRAMGEAYGIACLTYTQTFHCKRQVESTTGRVHVMRHIELFKMSFPAKPAQAIFDTYKESTEYSYIFYNNFIPARLVTVKHYQTEIITETQDFEKVKKVILEEAEKQAESLAASEGKVTKTETKVIDKGDIKYIQTTVEVEKSFL